MCRRKTPDTGRKPNSFTERRCCPSISLRPLAGLWENNWRKCCQSADIAISPEVEDIGFWQFNKSAQAIAAGEKAARRVLQMSKLTSVFSQS